ncbi:unnamed protein product [Peronospora belbahrii]|uniref:Uncharacterized protein n=1 Tax=Peronospora belbahrii TaxID=622444 RepID=A0ABN8D2R8_9STRA|nr:unnamed protein product [Peronospora belbahrii]
MAMTEEQQKDPQTTVSIEEGNVLDIADQVLSKLTQKPRRNSNKKTEKADQQESLTAINKEIEAAGGVEDMNNAEIHGRDKERGNEGFVVFVGRSSIPGEYEKESGEEKNVNLLVVEKTSVSMEQKQFEIKGDEDVEISTVAGEKINATTIGQDVVDQVEGCNDENMVVDTRKSIENDDIDQVMSLPVENVQSGNDINVAKVKDAGEIVTMTASSMPQEKNVEEKTMLNDDNISEGVEMAARDAFVLTAVVKDRKSIQEKRKISKESRLSDADVKKAVGIVVTTLVDNVVDSMADIITLDTEPTKVRSSSICLPHLSADEAIELLEAHQDDDHDLLPGQDAIVDDDVETKSKKCEYQWFDGDDEDDEDIAIEASSVLDVAPLTTDDVFEFSGVVELDNVTQTLEENADIKSDKSTDRQVVPRNRKNSSSSASSGSSSSSSSSSSCSSASCSEDESIGLGLKKRRNTRKNNGPRKLLKQKKQKCVRSLETDNLSGRRLKRKRKIPKPVIPPEYAVFNVEAADPVLKGSYSVRKNRRACFQGKWGFSDDAFHDTKNISPFEYTSHARVLQSRRKDDKHPISGKYGGFFKIRQHNGTLIKIREDQVELQFLPMPSSDEEDEDEDEVMEGYESDEVDGYEAVARRYTVLGKGKNRFGRFLIRGYLSPESGRLTVKRRYLD